MSEIFMVKKECEKYIMDIINIDTEMVRVYTIFFSSTADGIDRNALLAQYKNLINERKQLEIKAGAIIGYFSDIIKDMTANFLTFIDKFNLQMKVKKMEAKLKDEAKVEYVDFDEDEENVESVEIGQTNATNESNEISQISNNTYVPDSNPDFVVKPDPKYFAKDYKVESANVSESKKSKGQ